MLDAGFDVMSVVQQGMASSSDNELYRVCVEEKRCVVTLDLDFANPLRFPPQSTAGLIVLRITSNNIAQELPELLKELTELLRHASPEGKLWVVQRGRIREYQPE
jgi:predicted nuclease of predicted toxin-antitoxin system